MRRNDREITDYSEILEIMRKCDSCGVAFFNEKYPYIVPLNFGVTFMNHEFRLYFHGVAVGTKMELLKKNPNVAFEMDCSHRLILDDDVACRSTMEFESVCGNGTMKILSQDKKIEALQILMNQYQSGKKHEFSDNDLKKIEVMELVVDEISGKRLKRQA